MIALTLTAYERGLKDPAQHIAKPRPSAYRHRGKKPPMGMEEARRRQDIVKQALAMAPSIRALSRATGLDETQIGRWSRGKVKVSDSSLRAIQGYISERGKA